MALEVGQSQGGQTEGVHDKVPRGVGNIEQPHVEAAHREEEVRIAPGVGLTILLRIDDLPGGLPVNGHAGTCSRTPASTSWNSFSRSPPYSSGLDIRSVISTAAEHRSTVSRGGREVPRLPDRRAHRFGDLERLLRRADEALGRQ